MYYVFDTQKRERLSWLGEWNDFIEGVGGGDIWTVSSRILASRDESEGHSRKTEQSE